MLNLELQSNSNDRLELIVRDGIHFVVKTFLNDLERKERCIAKQRNFIPIGLDNTEVKSASISALRIYSERIIIEMPFVEGLTGEGFAIRGSKDIADGLSSSLSGLLKSEFEASQEVDVRLDIFKEKLHEVITQTQVQSIQNVLERVSFYINRLPKIMPVPVGTCHGDLTLSNVILNPTTGVVLIDFLDTFLESPLQDVAKLNQDFLCGWSFRNSPSAVQVKASLFTKAAYPKFAVEITKSYKRQVDLFTIMSLARIAPYIKDVITEKWLLLHLNKILDEAAI